MDFRLGGYECPGCGRMLLPASLEPDAPEPEVLAPPLDAFVQAAAAHAAAPEVPLLPPVLVVPQGYPFPLAPPPRTALPAAAIAPVFARDSNHSGEGGDSPLPPGAKAYTWAGLLPCGIFSFFMGDLLWGGIGLAGALLGLPALVYWAYIPGVGRERAWRMRRFKSVEEYHAVMEAWNLAGIVVTALSVLAMFVLGYYVVKIALKTAAEIQGYQ